MNPAQSLRKSLSVVAGDIVHGFMEITHNSFALVGLAVMFFGLTIGLQPDLRQAGQLQLMEWLQDHQETFSSLVTGTATDRVTAMDPTDLPKPQGAVTQWLSRKYNIAPEPMAALVSESFAACPCERGWGRWRTDDEKRPSGRPKHPRPRTSRAQVA